MYFKLSSCKWSRVQKKPLHILENSHFPKLAQEPTIYLLVTLAMASEWHPLGGNRRQVRIKLGGSPGKIHLYFQMKFPEKENESESINRKRGPLSL